MRRPIFRLLTLSAFGLALPAGAQVQSAVSTFSNYSSPFTTEYQAAVGRPVTSGVLDFYDTDLFVAGARNVLGTWGTSAADPGSVNRPSNIGSSTAMFATQLGEEVDVFGAGSDIVRNLFRTFSIFSMDVGHLYSSVFAPITLAPITFTVFGFGPGTGNATISQIFTIAAPPSVNGAQQPVLQTLTFDARWGAMSNVWWNQSTGSATAHQFTNVSASAVPEPGTYVLVLTGLAFLGLVQARRRRPS